MSKKTNFTKILSIFLSVLMLMSCWVFTPMATKAEAATAYNTPAWDGADTRSFRVFKIENKKETDHFGATYPAHIYLDISESLQDAGYYINYDWYYGRTQQYRTNICSVAWGGAPTSGGESGLYGFSNNFNNYGVVFSNLSSNTDGNANATDTWSNDRISYNCYIFKNANGDNSSSRTAKGTLQGTPKSTGSFVFTTSGGGCTFAGNQKRTGTNSGIWNPTQHMTKTNNTVGQSTTKNGIYMDSSYSEGQYYEMRMDATVYNKAALNSEVTKSNAIYNSGSSGYIASEWTAFTNALTAAQNVLTTRATTQTAIDAAKSTLENARRALSDDLIFDNILDFDTYFANTSAGGTISGNGNFSINYKENSLSFKCTAVVLNDQGDTRSDAYTQPYNDPAYYMPVTANHKYRISFDHKGSGTGTIDAMLFSFANNSTTTWITQSTTEQRPNFTTNTSWSTASFDYTVPSGGNYLSFRFGIKTDGCTVTFKNIRIQDITEYSTTCSLTYVLKNGGNAAGTLATAMRQDYVFEGWYTEKNGAGTKYTASTVNSSTVGGVHLWSNWVRRTVSFDVNHDNIGVNIFAPSEPTTSNGITSTYTPGSDIIELNGTTPQNVNTLALIKSPFTSGAGTYIFSVEKISGTKTGDGCIVLEPYKANGTQLSSRPRLDFSDTKSARVTITEDDYAQIDHIRIWVWAGGSGATPPTFNGFKFKVKIEKVNAKTEYSTSSLYLTSGGTYTLPTTNPTRTGYTFAGWWTAASGGSQVTASTAITNTNSHTLYAHWTPIKYTITFKNGNGETIQSGQWDYGTTPVYSGTTPTKNPDADKHYTFSGWSPAITTATADKVYTAQFTEGNHTFTYTDKNSTQHTKACSANGCTYSVDEAHTWTDTEKYLKSAATCTADAVYYKECSLCHASSQNKTNATWTKNGTMIAHSFTAATVKTEALKSAATCTSPAVYYYSCSACGAVESNANHTFTSGTMIAHDYTNVTPTWSWTGYTAATATFKCKNCTHTETVTAAITNNGATATCTQGATKVYTATASFNGQNYTNTKNETLSALGHTWTNSEANLKTAANCVDNAVYYQV